MAGDAGLAISTAGWAHPARVAKLGSLAELSEYVKLVSMPAGVRPSFRE